MVEAVRAKLERIESLIADADRGLEPTAAAACLRELGRCVPTVNVPAAGARRPDGARPIVALGSSACSEPGSPGLIWADDAVVGPLSLRRIGESAELVTENVTRPAPKFSGDTETRSASTLTPTRIGLGGRGSFAKSLEPQAVNADAATAHRTASAARRARREPLRAPVPIAANLADGRLAGVRRVSERELDDLGARPLSRPPPPCSPGSASRRITARAIGPMAGEMTAVPISPTSRSPSGSARDRRPGPRDAGRAGGGSACPL